MSAPGCGGQVPDLWKVSDEELKATIRELEAERESLEAHCCVLRRRIALLRAERLARLRHSHFDSAAAAEALLRRVPALTGLVARRQDRRGS